MLSDRREYSIDHDYKLCEPRDVQTFFNVIRRRLPEESADEFSERMDRVEHAREYLLRLFERSATVPQIEGGCVIQTEGRQRVAIWMHDDEEKCKEGYSTMGRWMPRTWGRRSERVDLTLTRSEKKHLDAIADMAHPGEIGHVIHRALQEYYILLVTEREAESIQGDRLNEVLYPWKEFQDLKIARWARRQWIWMRE